MGLFLRERETSFKTIMLEAPIRRSRLGIS